jgi:DNA-binding MarR family transcriptional regulator
MLHRQHEYVVIATCRNPTGGDFQDVEDQSMDMQSHGEIPGAILKDSVLAHVAAAYFSVGKRLERKTRCSATRAFVLSTLRGGDRLNQNRIALQLGIDRTVVHRAIKSMVEDGLVSEHKEKTGRAIRVQLTAKGKKYHERLVEVRKTADDTLRKQMTPDEHSLLVGLLQRITECEL